MEESIKNNISKIKNGQLALYKVLGDYSPGEVRLCRVLKEKGNTYICQNEYEGARGSTTHDFKYSYSISNTSELFQIKEIIEDEDSFIKNGKLYTIIRGRSVRDGNDNIINVERINMLFGKIGKTFVSEVKDDLPSDKLNLFKIKSHPDCCGCIMLYNFDPSSEYHYSVYRHLTEEDYFAIKEWLKKYNLAAKLAHLSCKQGNAIKFVEKLGFQKKFEYINKKTDNTIFVYHLH